MKGLAGVTSESLAVGDKKKKKGEGEKKKKVEGKKGVKVRV